jgi:hypothetical protein
VIYAQTGLDFSGAGGLRVGAEQQHLQLERMPTRGFPELFSSWSALQ